jgi:dCTP deaminase
MGTLTDKRIKEALKRDQAGKILELLAPHLQPTLRYKEPEKHGLIATDRTTKNLLKNDGFVIDPEPEPDQIQPASVELRVGNELYILNAGFTRFNLLALHRYATEKVKIPESGYVCHPGYIYVVKSHEKVRLPEQYEGETDAKSTTGRVGCMCHAFSEKFGVLEPGVPKREPDHFYFMVEPFAFPITLIPQKTRLFQMRLRERDSSHLDRSKIKEHYGSDLINVLQENKPVRLEKILEQDSLRLTLSTGKIYAHRRGASKPLDLTKQNFYSPDEYFEEIEGNEHLFMEKDRLYLLGTQERVKLGNLCGRLSREATGLGVGLLSHFAGFFDPGFDGEITLEFWSFRPWRILNGQYCGKVELEELCGEIENPYKGTYQGQSAPKLPKIFKA